LVARVRISRKGAMNKALQNYECEGQLSIFDLPDRKKELDAKYDIPRKYQQEEGWTDDWHYTELELPKENGIYYCIHYGLNSDFYNYTYMAWAYGHWWAYAGYGEKWLLVRGDRHKWMEPFAWVTVPDLYYRTDEHHQFLCEHFVTKEAWEYEQKMEELRRGNVRRKRGTDC
jgi:hypothetical protein